MNHYFMESGDEARRLEFKTDFSLLKRQVARLSPEPDSLAADIGCGTGVVARELRASGCRVIGVDANEARLATARTLAADASPIDFRCGSADRLPIAADQLDVSMSRFLYEYLPEPARALDEMIRVTKPGGRVCVIDLDGQIESLSPLEGSLADEMPAALEILRGTGFDTRIGRKLFPMCVDAGLRDIEVYVEPYQVFHGVIPEHQRRNWNTKIETVVAWLINRSGEDDRWRSFGNACRELLGSPRLFYAVNVIQVVGTKPRVGDCGS